MSKAKKTNEVKRSPGGYMKLREDLKRPTKKDFVLDFLRSDYEIHTTGEISKKVGITNTYTSAICNRLCNEDLVTPVERGRYRAIKKRRIVRVKKSTLKKIRENKSSSGK